MSTQTAVPTVPFPGYTDPRHALAWDAAARHLSTPGLHAHDAVIQAMQDVSGLPARDVSSLLDDALQAGWLVRLPAAGFRCLRVTGLGMIARHDLRPVTA